MRLTDREEREDVSLIQAVGIVQPVFIRLQPSRLLLSLFTLR